VLALRADLTPRLVEYPVSEVQRTYEIPPIERPVMTAAVAQAVGSE